MKNKKIEIILLIIVILASITLIWLKLKTPRNNSVGGIATTTTNSITTMTKDNLTPTSTSGELINIKNVISGQIIESPVTIIGEARGSWFFEASFPIKIYGSNGQLLGSTIAQATDDWMTDKMVPFTAELKFNTGTSTSGTLVFEKDNPSGLPENANELSMPVNFSTSTDKMQVKVFFMNNIQDPTVSCDKVFPVEREIIRTQAVARASLDELLNGVLAEETQKGFSTSINPNVKILSLRIENGIARVDFNDQLEKGVGGSCRVLAIRSQIIETLKQFNTVSDVIISINGRTEDILQP